MQWRSLNLKIKSRFSELRLRLLSCSFTEFAIIRLIFRAISLHLPKIIPTQHYHRFIALSDEDRLLIRSIVRRTIDWSALPFIRPSAIIHPSIRQKWQSPRSRSTVSAASFSKRATMSSSTTESVLSTETSTEEDRCLDDRRWYAFICSSVVTLLGGLFLVLFGRIVGWLLCSESANSRQQQQQQQQGDCNRKKKNSDGDAAEEIGWVTEAKDWAGELISGQTTTGRILVSVPICQTP